VAAILAVTLVIGGCGWSAAAGGAPPSDPLSGTVTVLAASSLTGAFKEVATAFQAAHSRTTVRFSFAGSQALAAQVTQGVPADIFASADEANMAKVAAAGAVDGSARDFATNKLTVVVPRANPKDIRSLADMARPDVTVVLCAPSVPCGTYAQQALDKEGVSLRPRSQEQDVKAVLTKVSLGEADAGIVYVTDAIAAGGVVARVDIPEAQNVVARYPIAVLKGSPNAPAARAFVDFLTGPTGKAVMLRNGFGPP
jgi:molybdate transport system substrate-binding protein